MFLRWIILHLKGSLPRAPLSIGHAAGTDAKSGRYFEVSESHAGDQ
jgi:hypothetical protein